MTEKHRKQSRKSKNSLETKKVNEARDGNSLT